MFGRSPHIAVIVLAIAPGCHAGGEADYPDGAAVGPPRPNTGRCTEGRAIAQIFYSDDSTPPVAGPRVDIRRQDGRVLMLRYEESGPDVRWWTDDDELASYTRIEVIRNTRQWRDFSGPGPDGRWLNEDDEPSSPSSVRCEPLDGAGRARGVVASAGPGDDGVACTEDDVVNSAQLTEYDRMGAVSRTIGSLSAGLDGEWLTRDDPVKWWARYDNEEDGAPKEIYFVDGPGPDREWFTSDDPFDLLTRWTYFGNDESEMKVVGNINGIVFGWRYYCRQPTPVPALN